MWIAALSALANFIPSLITAAAGAFNRYQERAQAYQQVELAKIEAQRSVDVASLQAESDLGTAMVGSTGPALKYISYFVVMLPFMLATVFPSYAAILFENWKVMPESYFQLVMYMNGFVWGVAIGAKAWSSAVSSVSGYMQNRTEQKVKVETVRTDNRVVFEAIKAISGGHLNQEQVDTVNRVLDKTRK